MKSSFGTLRCCQTVPRRPRAWFQQRRCILTLAIESSCDDTSVAILERTEASTELHFHEKITSDNRLHGGVHPVIALESHQRSLANLVRKSLQFLPLQKASTAHMSNALLVQAEQCSEIRKKPDFVTVTRGPGMRSSLCTGIDTAKGLATAWQVPLLGVNHMQAHALTPRLISSLNSTGGVPRFPFLTMLLSGGHTMLVQSLGLCNHHILAETSDSAVGNVLDKCARDILPPDLVARSGNVMYGHLLEKFAFPQAEYPYTAPTRQKHLYRVQHTPYQWSIKPPFASDKGMGEKRTLMEYSFTGIGSQVSKIVSQNPLMEPEERRFLAQETMRVAFEHLSSRLLMALVSTDIDLRPLTTIVLSGGVAANQYLRRILKALLEAEGFNYEIVVPPPALCTDNAAMIAWTGIEMWEAGYRSSLAITPLKKWTIDPRSSDGGILGVDGWKSRE